jgi:O-antigen/teichoic acid export membrane protein
VPEKQRDATGVPALHMTRFFERVTSLPVLAGVKKLAAKTHVLRRFTTGVFWTLIGNVVWRFLSAVSTISIARILGPQAFGEFGMIQSTIRMFLVYADFGVGATSTKYIAEHRISDPGKAGKILKLVLVVAFLLCGSVAAILFLASSYIANQVLHNSALAPGLGVGALLLFFLVYGEIKQCALAGFENFKAIAKANILRGVATPLICIPLAYFYGVEGAIAGLAIVSALMLMNVSIYLKKEQAGIRSRETVSMRDARNEIPILWKFALPGFIAGTLITIMTWFGRFLLTRQEHGYVELGFFEAAYQWQALILFLPAVFLRVILPIMSETYGKKGMDEFKAAVSMQFQAVCLISLPLVILTIGFSAPLAAIFGKQFESTETIIPILMLSVFFFTLNHSLRQVYDSTGKRWTNLMMYVIWAGIYLIGCLLFIPKMGATGFALTHLVAEMALLLVQALYVDFFLAPTIIRKHIRLLMYSFVLLGVSYLLQTHSTGSRGLLIMSGVLLLGLIPIFLKFRAIRT